MSFDGGGFSEYGSGFNNDSSFGNDGGFNGGGFDSGGMSQGGFSNSQQSPNTAKKGGEQSMMPLTIKQIKSLENREGKFKLPTGKDLSTVTYIGLILNVDVQNMFITYLLDDGTGKINAQVYINADDDDNESKHTQFRPNMYVRVVGNLKDKGGEVLSTPFQGLIPITDYNEVTMHFLDCIHSHLLLTKGEQKQDMGGNMNFSNNDNNFSNNAGQNQNNTMQSDDNGQSGGGGLNDQIMQVFKQHGDGEDGCSMDFVCSKFPNRSRAEIVDSISSLSDEGFLYSTIDEEHYKSTDN